MYTDYKQINHFPQGLGHMWIWVFAGGCGVLKSALDTKGKLSAEYFKNSYTEIKGKQSILKRVTNLSGNPNR